MKLKQEEALIHLDNGLCMQVNELAIDLVNLLVNSLYD